MRSSPRCRTSTARSPSGSAQLVAEVAPGAPVSIKWAQPVWESNGPFAYLKPFPVTINLGFWRGSDLLDPDDLLVGDGIRMRHLRIVPGDPLPGGRDPGLGDPGGRAQQGQGRPHQASLTAPARYPSSPSADGLVGSHPPDAPRFFAGRRAGLVALDRHDRGPTGVPERERVRLVEPLELPGQVAGTERVAGTDRIHDRDARRRPVRPSTSRPSRATPRRLRRA